MITIFILMAVVYIASGFLMFNNRLSKRFVWWDYDAGFAIALFIATMATLAIAIILIGMALEAWLT